MSEEKIVRLASQDKSTIKRYMYVIGAVLIIGVLGVWKGFGWLNDTYRPVDEGGAKISGTLGRNAVKEPTGLTNENTPQDLQKLIAEQNQRGQDKAAQQGRGQFDKLYNAQETVEKLNEIEFEKLLKQLEVMNDRMDSYDEQLANVNRSGGGSGRDYVADIDKYVGLDGVTYLSDKYVLEEKTRLDEMWANVEKAREVSITGNVTAFRRNGERTDREDNAIASLGTNNGSGFSRANGVRTNGRTARIDRQTNTNFGGGPNSGNNRSRSYEAIPVTGSQEIAQLDIGAHSGVGGPMQATILSGEFQGTTLIASNFQVNREYITINFTRFCLPEELVARFQQRCGSIDARAVDLTEQIGAVKGKYRGFYGIRLLGSTGAAFVQGLGRAYSTVIGPDTIIIDGTVTRQRRESLAREEAANAALQEVGTSLAATINDITQRPPETTARVNKEIGILILSPGVIIPTNTTTQALSTSNEEGNNDVR